MHEVLDLSPDVFACISPGLLQIARRCPDVTWTLGDLFRELLNRTTRLYVCDAHPEDFIIIGLHRNQHLGQTEMFVRAAYSPSADAWRRYEFKLIKLAQYFGAARITMQSSRKAFTRMPHWQPQSTLYAMEVPA